MTTPNQYPAGVADWATVCAWIRENRPDLWVGLGPEGEDHSAAADRANADQIAT